MQNRAKAERILWNYRFNVRKAGEMRIIYSWLQSVRGQDYGAHSTNGVSDPVAEIVHRKIAIEKKIKHLEKEIQAVEYLRDTLNEQELREYQMLGILKLRYIEHKEPDTVMRELGITKTTYYRRENELINRVQNYTRGKKCLLMA